MGEKFCDKHFIDSFEEETYKGNHFVERMREL